MRNHHTVDPALAAAQHAMCTEQQFLALPGADRSEARRVRFTAAELAWEAAEDAFADAVPTSPAGALAKLRALREMHRAMPMPDSSLEIRHVEALMAYVESLGAGAADRVVAETGLRDCA